MNEFVEQLSHDSWGRLGLQLLASGGLKNGFVLLLVVARLIGVFLVAPLGTTNLIPISARVGLVGFLSLIIAPIVSSHVPDREQITQIAHQTSVPDIFPDSVVELACLAANEMILGTLLGVGVITVFSGLMLGSEWIDRHWGLGCRVGVPPHSSAGDGACGQLIPLFGGVVFLLAEPIGGHWLLIRSFVESFQAIPLGAAFFSIETIGLLNSLVQQSFVLGIRIAIPFVLTMLLVDFTILFATRNSPIVVSSAAIAMKIGIGLLLLAMTLCEIPAVIFMTLRTVLSGNAL